MKNFQLLFLGIFFSLAVSWVGLVLSSHLNLGNLEPTTSTLEADGSNVEGDQLYPIKLGGIAKTGKDIYISQGCVYCHTQQVRQDGFGGDIKRGWGKRQTVAKDYIYQERVLLGTMRTGPDLADVGSRLTDANELNLHLYNPRIVSENSNMPPYPHLFELKEITGAASEEALVFPVGSPFAPNPGYEVVPTDRADALVAYMFNLKVDYELPEMKFSEEDEEE